jgi:general secretion pathway protein F
MPAFAYTGVTRAGKSVKGIENADNVAVLRLALKRKEIFLTAVTETSKEVAASSGGIEIDFSKLFDRVRPKDVARMTRLLSTLLCAGVTLPESLETLMEQVESQEFRSILSDLATKVKEGSALAEAMKGHPKVFGDLYINMIRAGEASGALETVLIRLAELMDATEATKSKVSSALIYPVIMGVVGAGVVILLMVKVVPKMAQMFASQGAQLPLATRILMWVSNAIADYWWLLLALALAGVWLFRRYRATKAGRAATDALVLKIPVLGDLARKVAIARFSRTLSTMLASGVHLLMALDIVRVMLGNSVLEDVITSARDNIREGEGIAPALKRSGHFPPLVTNMIAVGERSGQLEQMLNDVANAYDRETDTAVSNAVTMLGPLMLVAMGGSVGFIVMAIMSAMMQMNQMFAR